MHFSRIDKQKTINNVKEVLEGYEDMHIVESREILALQSPTISDMPKGSSVGNSSEKGALRYIQAKKFCTIVRNVINIIQNDIYKIILMDTYIEGRSNSETMDHLAKISSRYCFEDAHFFRLRREAQLTFAESCPPITMPGDSEPTELLVFKNDSILN